MKILLVEDIEIKNNEENEIDLIDVNVMFIQSFGYYPIEKLLTMLESTTHSVTKDYFFRLMEDEDLKQVANIVADKAVKEYKIEEGMCFKYFYKKLLRNKMNMLVREQRAEKRKCDTEAYSLDEAVGVIGEHIHGEASVMTQPEARAIMEDTYQDYLVELSSLEYDAFNLFNNGNALSKIAEELGYKEEQIRNALYRCSKKFRDIFKQ